MKILILICIAVMIMLGGIGFSQDCTDRTITWTPPTTNADGSSLTDLLSYFVYINKEQPIAVSKDLTSYSDCFPKAFTVYVTAVDTIGNESEPSNIVDKMPPAKPTGCSVR